VRVGQNPAKFVDKVTQPQRITVAIVTYIPFLGGYYAESLDILKLCLGSVWENSDMPFDLLIFDNGSCQEVRDYLIQAQTEGKIQYLLLSKENIGKGGAWNVIFSGAPGEYIAYADSDVYFYPGWLTALMGIFEVLPDTGMVTGMPLLNPEQFFTSSIRWAENTPGVSLERGRLLPWEDYWRHAGSLSNEEEKARVFYETHDSVQMIHSGARYYLGAGHFQFIAPKTVLQQTLPLPTERPMGQVRSLDEKINALGYLRLSTPQWWVQHLGNQLAGWQPQQTTKIKPAAATTRRTFWQWKPVRGLLTRIYTKTFELLYKS
jgi:hypothetical protein